MDGTTIASFRIIVTQCAIRYNQRSTIGKASSVSFCDIPAYCAFCHSHFTSVIDTSSRFRCIVTDRTVSDGQYTSGHVQDAATV